MFTLDEPYRTIIDIPDLEFRLSSNASGRAAGLVKDFRYGQFDAGRSRIVIDLAGPASIEGAAFTPPTGREPGVLSFALVRVAPAQFQAFRGTADANAAGTSKPELRGGSHDQALIEMPPPGAKKRPVVVIDPGHGGIDPGTVGRGGATEKTVTLAVARELRTLLQQGRHLDVYLTRDMDNFVSLDQRLKLSHEFGADLFVSIHADSLAEKELAGTVRGATVYVRSERASDEKARRMAEKENAADILAGLTAVPASAEDQVRNILLDLVQRETATYSLTFRNLLLSSMRGRVPLAKDPTRSAAFKVLKQDDVPAVLVELGYMSNAEDLARLARPDGQRQVAAVIASAITTFFAKRGDQAHR